MTFTQTLPFKLIIMKTENYLLLSFSQTHPPSVSSNFELLGKSLSSPPSHTIWCVNSTPSLSPTLSFHIRGIPTSSSEQLDISDLFHPCLGCSLY